MKFTPKLNTEYVLDSLSNAQDAILAGEFTNAGAFARKIADSPKAGAGWRTVFNYLSAISTLDREQFGEVAGKGNVQLKAYLKSNMRLIGGKPFHLQETLDFSSSHQTEFGQALVAVAYLFAGANILLVMGACSERKAELLANSQIRSLEVLAKKIIEWEGAKINAKWPGIANYLYVFAKLDPREAEEKLGTNAWAACLRDAFSGESRSKSHQYSKIFPKILKFTEESQEAFLDFLEVINRKRRRGRVAWRGATAPRKYQKDAAGWVPDTISLGRVEPKQLAEAQVKDVDIPRLLDFISCKMEEVASKVSYDAAACYLTRVRGIGLKKEHKDTIVAILFTLRRIPFREVIAHTRNNEMQELSDCIYGNIQNGPIVVAFGQHIVQYALDHMDDDKFIRLLVAVYSITNGHEAAKLRAAAGV